MLCLLAWTFTIGQQLTESAGDVDGFALDVHQVDCLIQVLDRQPDRGVVKFNRFVDLLRPQQVHSVAELLLCAVVTNLPLLDLKDFHEVPLVEVVVSSEPVLDFKHRQLFILFFLYCKVLPLFVVQTCHDA